MILITDIETDSLIEHKVKRFPSVIHVASTVDFDTCQMRSFGNHESLEPLDEYWKLLDKADYIVGHNFIQYDRPVIAKHTGYLAPLNKIEDTFVYSKLIDPKRPEGHSLAVYGELFGVKKPEHEDWSKFSKEMLHRNQQDCLINLKLYKYLKDKFKRYGFSEISYKVERNLAAIFYEQEEYGFPLRMNFAREKYYEIKDLADKMEKELVGQFEPVEDTRKQSETHYKPKYTKKGELHKSCVKTLERLGLPLDTPEMVHRPLRAFDPNSVKDRVRQLLSLGWSPDEFTETGQPRITETSLENFDNPIGNTLKTYVLLRNREDIFYRWLNEVDTEGFVHSPINQLGTWTHRCSHTNFFGNPPRVEVQTFKNIESFDSVDKDGLDPEYSREKVLSILTKKGECDVPILGLKGNYGTECRETWGIEEHDSIGQVGVDATGIQMRAFAHYINDKEYIDQVVSGDIHTYNKELAGLKTRADAKTFIYAFLLGAGDYKTGTIYKMTPDELQEMENEVMSGQHKKTRALLDFGLEYSQIPKTPRNYAIAYRGRLTKSQFIENIPGLKEIRKKAKIGWVTCLDGRKIYVRSKHLYLAALLQSFEACVIKRANVDYHKILTKEGIWFKQGNQIHDEYQIFGFKEDLEFIGDTVVKQIENAGIVYESKCPLTGEWRIGSNWKQTH